MLAVLLFGVSSVFAQMWRGDHRCTARRAADKPLFEAIFDRHPARLEKLLKAGGDARAVDDCNIALITYAAWAERADLLAILLKAGANPSVVDGGGQPPLLFLVERAGGFSGSPDGSEDAAIKTLLDGGADVNFGGRTKTSALILATGARNAPLVRALLDAGAKIDFRDGEDRTAYSYAAQLGCQEVKEMLAAAGASLDAGLAEFRAVYGDEAFYRAASDGRTDLVEAMLAAGANPDSVGRGTLTALMGAREPSTIDALLAAGATLEKRDGAGFTALMWAVAFRKPEIVRRLIAAGADVNARNNDGKSVLELARDPETEEILKAAGAK